MPKVTVEDLIKAGKPFVCVEYRGEESETIQFMNKKTGSADSFESKKLYVEVGAAVQQAQIRLSRDCKLPTTYKKGDKLFVVIRAMNETSGHLVFDSSLENIHLT